MPKLQALNHTASPEAELIDHLSHPHRSHYRGNYSASEEQIAMLVPAHQTLVPLLVVLLVSVSGVWSKSFTVTNNCGYMVWPGILSAGNSPALDSTGFALAPGESWTMTAPHGWSGRLWGRMFCSTDSTGRFTCVTGDCGSGRLDCAGNTAKPPATLAEFTLDGSGGMDFYDVSLVDGYNLPLLVTPQGGVAGGNCVPTGCMVDLNGKCPAELRVASPAAAGGGGVACKSACEAFGSAQYCCSGEYSNPNTCRPSAYSQFFKNACPRAYSYAYDDDTSTYTCAGGDTSYDITFCPSTASVKSIGTDPGMVYAGGAQVVSSSPCVAAAPWLPLGVIVLGVSLLALARSI